MAPRPVQSVKYETDNGEKSFALIVHEEGDNYNLAVLDPDTYNWNAVNSVPKDSERIS